MKIKEKLKQFWNWKYRDLIVMLVLGILIIVNGTLVINKIYPLWVGYFNYVFALTPIYLFLKKR